MSRGETSKTSQIKTEGKFLEMRVTKRIEEYVRDEVRKISACKEAAIREKYQPEFDALEAFKEAIVKSAKELDDSIRAKMLVKGYRTTRYCENIVQTPTFGIYTPAKQKMDEEIAEINTWIDEQTRLMCVKLEMGGDMNTLTTMLEELRKEF